MPTEQQQTLCVTKSEVYAVESAPDFQNPSELAQTSQQAGSYSDETGGNIVRKLPLRNGGFTLIDEADYHLVEGLKWRVSLGGYVVSSKGVLLHRLILGIHGLRIAESDHLNHDKLDNRRCNLRIVTRSVNCQNRRKFKNGKNQFKGVTPNGAKWRARIYKDGKYELLGNLFATQEQAALAYNYAALKLFGPQACLNVIPSPAERAA